MHKQSYRLNPPSRDIVPCQYFMGFSPPSLVVDGTATVSFNIISQCCRTQPVESVLPTFEITQHSVGCTTPVTRYAGSLRHTLIEYFHGIAVHRPGGSLSQWRSARYAP